MLPNNPDWQVNIRDWAGNICYHGKVFDCFDDAEEFLCIQLGDDYDTDRQEYYIVLLNLAE